MKFVAGLNLLIGTALAWLAYDLRSAFVSPDAWLAAGLGLLAALMLVSGSALVAGAAWGLRLGLASSGAGLLVALSALAVGLGLLIGGEYEDIGSGAAKAALGAGLLLVFALAFSLHRITSRRVTA